jgi:hypothetical protein
MDFIKIEAELPPPNYLVMIKRKNGTYYLGYRYDKPLSTDPDPSKNCYWSGSPIDDLEIKNGRFDRHRFSDVTVESWAYIGIEQIDPVPNNF